MSKYYLCQEDAEKYVSIPCGCAWTYIPKDRMWENDFICEDHDPTVRIIDDDDIPRRGRDFGWKHDTYTEYVFISNDPVGFVGKNGVTFKCQIQHFVSDDRVEDGERLDDERVSVEIFVKYECK